MVKKGGRADTGRAARRGGRGRGQVGGRDVSASRGRGGGREVTGRGRSGGREARGGGRSGGREARGRGRNGGRDTRGRGRGRAGGHAASPYDALPEGLRAFRDGWSEITKYNEPYRIVKKGDVNEHDDNGSNLAEMYLWMADKMTTSLTQSGFTSTSYNIFTHLLSDIVLLKIIEYTNHDLVLKGHPITNLLEFKQFIGTRWLRSRLKVSPELAFNKMQETAKYHGFPLMDRERYKNIYGSLRGFPLKGRHTEFNDEITWMRRGVLLRNLAPLEKDFFERSVETLLCRKNGNIVIDDELIGSRAKDVETKALSHRKAGKEGPATDAIACSFTSVLFGMRLRIRGEKLEDNVHALIDTIPKITSDDEHIRLTFDRGYGTMRFIRNTTLKKFEISTIATTVGSRHPFLTKKESDKFLEDCKARGDSVEEIVEKYKLYESWICDADEMYGSRIRTAKKDLGNGKTVYAYAINELFDPSTEEKLLRFFRTEAVEEENIHTFVAVPRDGEVDELTLFGGVGDSEHRLNVEDKIQTYCHPLTLGQKCADWFLMKCLISGTIAGKIVAEVERFPDGHAFVDDEELMRSTLRKCMESWFKRHKASTAMTMGTENEEPTFEALRHEPCVTHLFEVGLLQSIDHPVLGVSPDGIAVFTGGGFLYDGEIGCVEIKTRVKPATIARAEAARRECGRIVWCSVGDDAWMKCVPRENRYQVLHQAAVTKSLVGMFVTAKIEEDRGSIVQIVNVLFPASVRAEYIEKILGVVEPLIGWYLDRDLILQGYIEDKDFPEWTDLSIREIMKSRARLLYAHYNFIIDEEGDYHPTLPLLLYKHHVQVMYNQGKPGLDKNTELAMRVKDVQGCSFETKYVLSLLDRILVNAWRAEVAITTMKPWLTKLQNDGITPSILQIRRKFRNENTIDDYVDTFAIGYLQVLQRGAASLLPINMLPLPLQSQSPDKPMQSRKDNEVLQILETLKKKGKWPCQRDRLKQFLDEKDLNALRLYESRGVNHLPIKLQLGNKESRKKCVLCCHKNVGRNATHYCSICLVPLCTTIFRGLDGVGTERYCFQRFHTCTDLKRQCNLSHEWLIKSRNFDKRKSPKLKKVEPTKEEAKDKVRDSTGDNDATIDENSNFDNCNDDKKRKPPTDSKVPSTVKVRRTTKKKDVKDEKLDSEHAIVIEKINKTWCKTMGRSRGGLRKKDYDALSKFGTIQDVIGDGNCGVYAAIEGLLNCLIAVTIDVGKFRKEVHDFVDTHRKEVLTNFTFSGKLKKDGSLRGKRRDDWLSDVVMKRIWTKGNKYLPTAEEDNWVTANFHYPVLAVMYDINFVWYDLKDQITYATIKIPQGRQRDHKEKTIEKKGIVKPNDMIAGSVWEKIVICLHYKNHFMNLKELLEPNE